MSCPPPSSRRSMNTAPRDGTIIAVIYREWKLETNPERVQLAQWLEGDWRPPGCEENTVYADSWVSLDELVEGRSEGYMMSQCDLIERRPSTSMLTAFFWAMFCWLCLATVLWGIFR